MILVSFISVDAAEVESDGSHANLHHHEHEDEHHLNLLIYYCLAIVPVLASLILLPNTCYSIPGRRRVNREEKMD